MAFWDKLAQYAAAAQPLAGQLDSYNAQQTQNDVFAANPDFAAKLYAAKNNDAQTALQRYAQGRGVQPTADIQNYQFLKGLTDEEKKIFYDAKRAPQNLDAGGSIYTLDPITKRPVLVLNKTLSPENLPSTRADQAGQAAQAVANVDMVTKPIVAANTTAAEFGVKQQMEPALNAANKAATEAASANVTNAQKNATDVRNASASLSAIKEARSILPQATNGGGEAALKGINQWFGNSTNASKADAKLNIVGAKLVQNVPRFEGPQSNIDVQSYNKAAADVANPELPIGDRLAALDTVESLAKKAASQAPITIPQTAALGNLPNVGGVSGDMGFDPNKPPADVSRGGSTEPPRPVIKTIGGVTYINQGGQWYQQ